MVSRFSGSHQVRSAYAMQASLDKAAIPYAISNAGWVQLVCPFHNNGSTGFEGGAHKLKLAYHPSGRSSNCWICGKQGDFNTYAALVGCDQITDEGQALPEGALTKEMARLRRLSAELPPNILPNGIELWEGPWRRLSASFLKRYGIFKWWDDKSRYYRILFPIVPSRNLDIPVGYTAGRGDPKQKPTYEEDPKYRTSRGMSRPDLIIGLDRILRKSEFVVLTEGPYDALRALMYKIPAISIMGVFALEEVHKRNVKIEHILAELPYLQTIVCAFDGDSAGDKSAIAVVEMMKSTSIKVIKADIPNQKDLGSVTSTWMRNFRDDLAQKFPNWVPGRIERPCRDIRIRIRLLKEGIEC